MYDPHETIYGIHAHAPYIRIQCPADHVEVQEKKEDKQAKRTLKHTNASILRINMSRTREARTKKSNHTQIRVSYLYVSFFQHRSAEQNL